METAAPGRSFTGYLMFFGLFFGVLLLSHAMVLDLPYFWDELGQFVPAALDLYEQGAWVPRSTLPNVHPPGVMAYLAGVWTLTGYSVPVTRMAMLALAAAGVLCVFVLAIELGRPLRGMPAFAAAALLLASPLFWAQSMMVQLDMPAMTFTALSLLLFLRGRYGWCAAACTALVLMKETSLAVPAVFGVWLLWERRWRHALLFFLPAAALAVWLWILYRATGHIFGNQEFTHYNITFQLHPVRLPMTLVRRFFYLFVDNFHWVGSLALVAGWRAGIFRNRAWAVVAAAGLLQTFVVSVLGGAALERYLMPVVPLFYIAVAAAWSTLGALWRRTSAAVMIAGLVVSILVSSPFPYPFENNSAFVAFVRLQQRAARFIEAEYPNAAIASAWPFPDALRRPEYGFTRRPMACRGLENFNTETVLPLRGKVDVLVVYSRTWEPRWGVIGRGWVRRFLAKYYYYAPQISPQQIEQGLHLTRVARWEQRGQWIEVWARAPEPVLL